MTGFEISPNGQMGFNPEKVSFNIYTNLPSEFYIDETMSTDTKIYVCAYYVKTDNWGEELQIKVWSYEEAEDIAVADISLSDGGSMSTLSLSGGNILVSPIGICIYEGALGFDMASYIHKIVLRYADGSEYVLTDNDAFVDNSMYALGQYGQSDGSAESGTPRQGDGALPTPVPADDGITMGYRTTYLFNRIVDISSLSEIILDDLVISVSYK